MITQARLKEVLNLNEETGEFTWRWRADVANNINGRFAGKRAGHLGKARQREYVFICVDGRIYRAHCLVVLWITGQYPTSGLDHKNCIRHHNGFTNLRPASASQNGANRSYNKNNKLKLKGVSWAARERLYRATITQNRKQTSLGYSSCPAAAHFAYIIEADKRFGEFARFN